MTAHPFNAAKMVSSLELRCSTVGQRLPICLLSKLLKICETSFLACVEDHRRTRSALCSSSRAERSPSCLSSPQTRIARCAAPKAGEYRWRRPLVLVERSPRVVGRCLLGCKVGVGGGEGEGKGSAFERRSGTGKARGRSPPSPYSSNFI